MREKFEAIRLAIHELAVAMTESSHERENYASLQLHKAVTETVRLGQFVQYADIASDNDAVIQNHIRGVQSYLTTVLDFVEVGTTPRETRALKSIRAALDDADASLGAAPATHALNDPAVRQKVRALTDGRCSYCDCDLPDNWHIDHVVPKSAGGPDNIANYVPSCPSCNISKNGNHVLDFIKKSRGKVVAFRSEGAA